MPGFSRSALVRSTQEPEWARRVNCLWNGYEPPVLGSLVALAIAGGGLPFSLGGPGRRRAG